MITKVVSQLEFDNVIWSLKKKVRPFIKDPERTNVVLVPRGGLIVAQYLAYEFNIKSFSFSPVKGMFNIVVDEINDSGKTFADLAMRYEIDLFASLYKRKNSIFDNYCYGELLEHDFWLKFPWDKEEYLA